MIELEPDPAGEQRDDELVEADALGRGRSDELSVKAGGASNEDAAVGGHVANSSASAIDTSDSACDSAPMPSTTTLQPRAYLIVTGDVEIGPGQFARGICRSSPCEDREAAQAKWDSYVARGLYEEPFETYEIRDVAPTLGEVLSA